MKINKFGGLIFKISAMIALTVFFLSCGSGDDIIGTHIPNMDNETTQGSDISFSVGLRGEDDGAFIKSGQLQKKNGKWVISVEWLPKYQGKVSELVINAVGSYLPDEIKNAAETDVTLLVQGKNIYEPTKEEQTAIHSDIHGGWIDEETEYAMINKADSIELVSAFSYALNLFAIAHGSASAKPINLIAAEFSEVIVGEYESTQIFNLLANNEYIDWIGDGEFVDNGMGGWQSGGWVAHGEYVDFKEKSIATNELSWTVVVDKEDERNNIWPWGDMTVFFDVGALSPDAEIRLTYESDKPIKLILNDITEIGGMNVVLGGAAYSADLPKTTGPKEMVLKIGSSQFKQPAWAKDADLDYTFDVANIEGFAFSNGDTYGTTINVKITRLEVIGLYENW